MANKQSKRARRETARRAQQRQRRVLWGTAIAVLVLGVGAVVVLGGSADREAAPASDFELTSSGGDTVRLSDYRGQPVALTFMHTW